VNIRAAMPHADELKALPARLGVDAVIAMSPENFIYASGSNIETVLSIRPRQAFAVFGAAAEPFVLICTMEEAQTRVESWIADVRGYTEFADDPIAKLAAELKAQGIATGKIGIDLDYLPVTDFERLCAFLPGVTLVNSGPAVAAIRAVKTNNEVSALERYAKATHRSVLDAMSDSRLGDDEQRIANRIAHNLIDNGAQSIGFLYFASGDRTIQPHANAVAGRVPQPGDIIRFDVCGKYGAFMSDFARTYSAGEPTAAQKQIYASLIDCEIAGIEAVRPGATAEDVFYACGDAFRRHGLQFHMPHVGHSFGVELHENPMLRPGNKTKLMPGMVLNIEPGVRDENGSLYHSEDLVVVTDEGYRCLTLGVAPRELPVMGQKLV
jgi:Xaa-Pro aminopeptidase